MDTVVVVGLASVYLWYLLAFATLFDRPLGRIRDRWPMLIGCPWCCGFWISGILLLVTGNYDPLTHLATAATVGVVGRLAT